MGNNWIKELEKLEGKLETITNDYREGIETKESGLLKIYAIELRTKDVIIIIEIIKDLFKMGYNYKKCKEEFKKSYATYDITLFKNTLNYFYFKEFGIENFYN